MRPRSQEELASVNAEAAKLLKEPGDLFRKAYRPDRRIKKLLAKIRKRISEGQWDAELGRDLEVLAFLAFQSLSGHSEIISCQSAGPQYDLLICGNTQAWLDLCSLLHVQQMGRRTIFVEAKANGEPANDAVMHRMSSILANYLEHQGALGVLFAVNGATGEPTKAKPIRGLRDSRLTRTLCFAKTGRAIALLTWEEMQSLDQEGSLPHFLEKSIRDLESAIGLPSVDFELSKQSSLPTHLAELGPCQPKPKKRKTS